MNEHTLASIAFEAWYARPQRDRTIEGLLGLVDQYAVSHYGPMPYTGALADMLTSAYQIARGKVRPWHIAPDAIDQLTRG